MNAFARTGQVSTRAPHHNPMPRPPTSPLDQLALRENQSTSRSIALLSGDNGFLFQPVEAVAGTRLRINGRWVLNFTSSNYLGLNHDSSIREAIAATARRWGSALATPRLLATDSLTRELESALARLVHRDKALVFPSTLHAAIDVMSLLAGDGRLFMLDERAYPISVAAARLAVAPHGRIRRFRHDNAGMLARLVSGQRHERGFVIVCDGVYPETGLPASLQEIGQGADSEHALVYVDDAHGLGVFGAGPTAEKPYGLGGGGSVLHTGAKPDNIAYVSSLSKAFGVPLAFVAGPAHFIDYLRLTASSVAHSSPPALPVVAAALATLRQHDVAGDELRRQMLNNVDYFRHAARQLGLTLATRSEFPIQSITFTSAERAFRTGKALRQRGIWPVLVLRSVSEGAHSALRVIITARHDRADIDELLDALSTCVDL